MEKRLVVFIILSVAIMVGYTGLKIAFGPPPVAQQDADKQGDEEAGKDKGKDKDKADQDKAKKDGTEQEDEPKAGDGDDQPKTADANEDPPKPELESDEFDELQEKKFPERHLVLRTVRTVRVTKATWSCTRKRPVPVSNVWN